MIRSGEEWLLEQQLDKLEFSSTIVVRGDEVSILHSVAAAADALGSTSFNGLLSISKLLLANLLQIEESG